MTRFVVDCGVVLQLASDGIEVGVFDWISLGALRVFEPSEFQEAETWLAE